MVKELHDFHVRVDISHTRKVVSEEKRYATGNQGDTEAKDGDPDLKKLDDEELSFGSIQDKLDKLYALKNKSKDDNYSNNMQANTLLG